ncbi:hypothetical protein HPB48_001094 [Haemaphysalis longicornis]|uniref:Uncharacterized protein n=1 Tax=Haemaphysalis longicornis TaxID=44386 RepID=A0A9J6G688_HAELO|nr:hypothetical protein HPB48_001094 [Haemaphysalis longicornis]
MSGSGALENRKGRVCATAWLMLAVTSPPDRSDRRHVIFSCRARIGALHFVSSHIYFPNDARDTRANKGEKKKKHAKENTGTRGGGPIGHRRDTREIGFRRRKRVAKPRCFTRGAYSQFGKEGRRPLGQESPFDKQESPGFFAVHFSSSSSPASLFCFPSRFLLLGPVLSLLLPDVVNKLPRDALLPPTNLLLPIGRLSSSSIYSGKLGPSCPLIEATYCEASRKEAETEKTGDEGRGIERREKRRREAAGGGWEAGRSRAARPVRDRGRARRPDGRAHLSFCAFRRERTASAGLRDDRRSSGHSPSFPLGCGDCGARMERRPPRFSRSFLRGSSGGAPFPRARLRSCRRATWLLLPPAAARTPLLM